MKYMLLLRTNPDLEPKEGSPELDAEMARWGTLTQELQESGVLVAGMGLDSESTATTLRAPNGERVLTDGPFAETKELLFSYYVIDVADLDAAATSSTTRATPPPPATTWCATSSATMRCAWPGCWPS